MQSAHHRAGKAKAKDSENDAQNEKAEQGGRHDGFHFAVFSGAEIAAYEHTGADTGSQRHADENVGQGSAGADRCKSRGADKLTDDDGVSHIVHLLKKAAEDHRHCKNCKRLERRICDQIFILRHYPFPPPEFRSLFYHISTAYSIPEERNN